MNCLLMCLNFIRLRFNKMEQLVTLTHTHYGRTSCCMIGAIEVPVVKGTLAHFICTMPPRDELGILDFYCTQGNRVACGNVEKFEFIAPPPAN